MFGERISEIEILSIVSVQTHRIMFANHEIFENYYNPGYAGGGGRLYACSQLKLITFAKVDYVHLNSHDRANERARIRGISAVFQNIRPVRRLALSFLLILHFVVTCVKLHFASYPCICLFVCFSFYFRLTTKRDINSAPAADALYFGDACHIFLWEIFKSIKRDDLHTIQYRIVVISTFIGIAIIIPCL